MYRPEVYAPSEQPGRTTKRGSASHMELEDGFELGYGEIAVRLEESLQCLE